MKRGLAILLLLLLALPLRAQDSDVGEDRDPELKPADVFIPREYRVRNERGNCVWCAVETILAGAGYKNFIGMRDRALQTGWHGACLWNVIAALETAKIPYKSQPTGTRDPQILYDSVHEGTGAYIQIPGHALALVGIDDESVRLIDNNGPPVIKVWPRGRFNQLWEGAACYPLRRSLKAEWKIVGKAEYLYRGPRLLGCWNPVTQTWWEWDGQKYLKGTHPWRNK